MKIHGKMQGLRRRLYAGLFDALGERGLSRFYAPKFAGIGVVVSAHRIIEAGDATLEPGYALTTTALETYLESVRRIGWDIVTPDQVHDALVGDRGSRRFVCFTFDDGYADNYRYALPIFRRYGAPMAVYVATGLLERSIFYWWAAVERLILHHEEIDVDLPDDAAGARRLQARTLAEKRSLNQSLNEWCHANLPRHESALRALLARYGIDPGALLDADALSVQQLAELSRDPLVTIGSHCMSHRRLSTLPEAEVAEELGGSRRILEATTGREVRHVAYPFGSRDACGPREFAAAAACGYRTGVTTRRGNIFSQHRGQLLSLPRREADERATAARENLYGVSAILRGEPAIVTD
jgi:peptidoglycan/xylan/chitin deacetylase (PgdA/CDA1 family)